MTDVRHSGRCRCGAISVQARAEPFWRSYCHCDDCRRQSGAPVLAFVGFHDDDLIWSGEMRNWACDGATRGFCGTCGSQVAYRHRRLPGDTFLTLGFMDRPDLHPPALHAFAEQRLPFFRLDDGLPCYARFSIQRSELS